LDSVEGDADPENMYAVAKKLIALSCASESKWDQSANQFSCIKFFPSEKADKQFIEFLKQAYADEVFDEVEVPMGEVKRNNNAKYF
jgi:CRISPR/Cas system-associated protein Cas5 (RAMP superfamily)